MRSIDPLSVGDDIEERLLEVEQNINAALHVAVVIRLVEAPARTHVLCIPFRRLKDGLLLLLSVLNGDAQALVVVVSKLERALVHAGLLALEIHGLAIKVLQHILGQEPFSERGVRLDVHDQKSSLVGAGPLGKLSALAYIEKEHAGFLYVAEVLERLGDPYNFRALGSGVKLLDD